VEDPTPGALFPDEQVRYTIASLFLAKPPVPEVPLPRCERRGSSLDSLVIPMLPSRMHKSAAHTQAVLSALCTDLGGETSSDNGLSANGNGNSSMRTRMEAVRLEADERERGLHELTRIIVARDARIIELAQTAEERLAGLNSMHAHIEVVRREADERERGLHELTRIIAVRDARIAELEQVADERLAAINRSAEQLRVAAAEAAGLEVQQRRDEALLSEATERQATLSKQLLALERETLLEYFTRRVGRLKAG
jgi:hypothetical protein